MTEETLFATALDKTTAVERQRFLNEACGGDTGLRQRVERLLAAHAQAVGILERGPDIAVLKTIPPGPTLAADHLFADRFQLRQKLGEGGMGEVWAADQTEPVQRRVALKVMRPGFDTARLLARFDQERQALALMDHPNIAKVLDAGVADGRPYFVMELIQGVPINEYCDAAGLSPRERLQVFISVCHAVQHAHQKGIIHRDLKPSNILVANYDGRPAPKVIDFGVAKATGPRLTEQSVHTEIGWLIGTLEYMSPEQAKLNALDIDTRSDVYALGAVLYELLTGSVPFSRHDLQAAAFTEMLRLIQEIDPPKPSAKLSGSEKLPSIAAVRQTEPKKLVALVRGELDWIVMKCLEKDRARRYETANGFALDLQCYLADEAVSAGPPSAGYRIGKFVRRNWGPVLAASIIALALVGGIIGTTIGFIHADRARQAEADRAVGERRAKLSAEKRLAQIEKGIDLLGSLFTDLDPMAEEQEGRPLRAILGDRLDRAASELEGEAVGDPLVVARLQVRLGHTYLGLGQGARAQSLFAKAAATRRAHLGLDDPLTLESRHNLAVAHEAAGHQNEAIELFEQVRDTRMKVLGPDHLDTLTTLHDLAVAYSLAGRTKDAIPLLERARDGRVQQLGEGHDQTLATLEKLSRVYLTVSRRTEAVALAQKVWDARVKLHGDGHSKSIAAMGNLAFIYQGAYRMPEALALFEHARDKIVPKLGDYHPLTLTILRNLGHMLRAYDRTSEAIPLLEQVRERELMVLGSQHPSMLPTLLDLAASYKSAGDPHKALSVYQQAAAAVEKLNFEHSYADMILSALSLCHEVLEELELAESWRRKSLDVIQRRHGTDSGQFAIGLNRLGSVLIQQKKSAAAEPTLRQVLTILQKHPNAGEKLYAQSLLGTALADQNHYAEAEPLLVEAYRGMKNFAVEHKGEGTLPDVRRFDAAKRLVQLYSDWDKPEKAAEWKKEFDAATKAAEPAVKPNGK